MAWYFTHAKTLLYASFAKKISLLCRSDITFAKFAGSQYLAKADRVSFATLVAEKERETLTGKVEKKRRLFVGIDPGLTGAVAVIDKNGKCLLLSDCPTEKKSLKKIVSPHGVSELVASIKKLKGKLYALLEEPIAMPRAGRSMGATSMLSFGRGVGIWEGALSMAGIQVNTVHPRVWKRKMFPKNGSDKNQSLKIAKKLFPAIRQRLNKSNHHGRAEALLIAYYLLTISKNGGKLES